MKFIDKDQAQVKCTIITQEEFFKLSEMSKNSFYQNTSKNSDWKNGNIVRRIDGRIDGICIEEYNDWLRKKGY